MSNTDYDCKVSVIIPMYNVEKYIRATICSVLRQTLKNIEVICVDDGSNDRTVYIVKELMASDNRIVLNARDHNGLAASRNAGLLMANGKYVYYLDSDDTISDHALEVLFDLAETNKTDIIAFEGNVVFESPELEAKHNSLINYYRRNVSIDELVSGQHLLCICISSGDHIAPSSTYFYNRLFLLRNNIYYKNFQHEDEEYSIQSLVKADRCLMIHDQLYTRFVRGNSTTTSEQSLMSSYGSMYAALSIADIVRDNTCSNEVIEVLSKKVQWMLYDASRICRTESDEKVADFIESLSSIDKIIYKKLIKDPIDNQRTVSDLRGRLKEQTELCIVMEEAQNNTQNPKIHRLVDRLSKIIKLKLV